MNTEDFVYRAVEDGELLVDNDGKIWRVATRRWDRRNQAVRAIPCERRRAEHDAGEYLMIRAMFDGVRKFALAHRLIWRHFYGPIPKGLTINHKNGIKKDNRLNNLELATYAEQALHALHILRVGRTDQYGERNAMARLTTEQIVEICTRRGAGESLKSIASDFGVAYQTISKIARGDRRSRG